MLEKNSTVCGTCEGLGTNGEGVVRIDGVTLFVPELLTGERADIKILKIKNGVGYGKAEEIYTPSEIRVRPKCPVFSRCGGCQLQHISYREQLKFKTRLVQEALRKIGGISFEVAPCEKSESQFGYRNKLQLPIGYQDGKNVIGFYAERSHRIIPITHCPIHPDWAEGLISALRNYMTACKVKGYDEERGEGLRHVVVREIAGYFLVTLVSTSRTLKGVETLTAELDKVFHEYSLFLNYNQTKTNVIFGEEFFLLKGEATHTGTECGILYEAGPSTFLQVNEGVRKKLYSRAVSLAVEENPDVVVDCYAGGGLMTAMLAKKCKKAYGIEIVPEASACADSLKLRNNLEGKMFNLCGRVEDLLDGVLEDAPRATLVLDPPRAGIDRSVLQSIIKSGIDKLVLISCNPATLARDLGILTGTLIENDKGELVKSQLGRGMYEITLVQPYDMFPQSKHVETIVQLRRRK